jgi:hypothetical protein
MVSIRSTVAALLLVASTSAATARPTVSPILATTLSGTVKDDVGRVLEGVEIVILAPEGRGDGAFLRAVSDAGGRFVVGAVNPGVYRIAAIKSGYTAALGRVNTMLRSSVDLVLRPVPKEGQPGVERVLDDLSWTLRVPPKSILRALDPRELLASRDTGGARAFAARIEDSVRGEVDHMIAIGSWRPAATGPSSSLEGNETRMRFAGILGERGAIQVRGRHGSLDSSSSPTASGSVSRGNSDVDLDLSYDTSADESLAMRAFYSAGDLELTDRVGVAGVVTRQGQRSWGYDAKWRKQVDASSHVALRVGYHDANLDLGPGTAVGWDPAQGDASNWAIGAEGSYENLVGDGHLVRVGVRAQRLSLAVPTARLGRSTGAFTIDGPTGWSLLVDSEDQWSVAGPIAVSYGVAVHQGFDANPTTVMVPRVGGFWTRGGVEARAEVSYLATTGAPAEPAGSAVDDHRSRYGYDVELKTRLAPALTLRGTATYLPSRADVWRGQETPNELAALYVTDGFASDRFVALDLEHAAPSATVSFRVARGRAEGALAPAIDDVPVVLLSERAMDYDAARLGVNAPRAGSAVSIEYRAIREHAAVATAVEADALRTVALDFAQQLVRFAGGRASCRLLVTARRALGNGPVDSQVDPTVARQFVEEHKRIAAGLSLAF